MKNGAFTAGGSMDLPSLRHPVAVALRDVTRADVAVFFDHQLDPGANFMAAFTAKDPSDRVAFDAKWEKIFADPGITMKTVLVEGRVAGNVMCHGWFGEPEVCYWIGREYWGRGIASRALAEFLKGLKARPLHACVAKDNHGSIRVLEKCGFRLAGEKRGFANGRGEEIAELVFVLEPAEAHEVSDGK